MEQRALEVIRNIRHPHLLDVQFATRVDDCLVIAMPLCDQSLMDRLRACLAERRPGVPRNELLRYMDELARAVDFLNEPRHRAEDGSLVGVQHRDIKPHNIFLVGGSVRLADFGLAKILAASGASTQGSMSPNYVAPEVIEGQVSRWSDQYSLAVTYCQLRTGRLPFVGETAIQIIYAHVHTCPRPVGPARGGAAGRGPRPGEAARGALADVPRVRARPDRGGAGGRPARVRSRRESRGAAGRGRDEAPRDAGAAARSPPPGSTTRSSSRRCGRGDGWPVRPRRTGGPGGRPRSGWWP